MEELTLLIAFAAGLLSFFSPCVLPLIPSYLSFVGGVEFAAVRDGSFDRRRIILRTVAFVVGFSIVFVLFGVLVSSTSFLFAGVGRWVNVAAGAIVVVLGVNVMFGFISVLNYEKRAHLTEAPSGYLGAAVVGMAFGAGWSPCIGPILASILILAGTSGEIGRGVVLLSVYSIGLGVPFLIAAGAFGTISRRIGRITRYLGTIRVASGLFLVVMGLLIALGRFQLLNAVVVRWGFSLQAWSVESPAMARRVFAIALAGLGILGPIRRLVARKRLFHPVATPLSAILVAGAILQALGVIDTAGALAVWLTYQGI